jgi:hypothetical protein
MSQAYEFPPAVVLGLWLNGARTGVVSPTDAANALETITGQIDIQIENQAAKIQDFTWVELINLAMQTSQPVAVALPVDGDPAGVPVGVLKQIFRESGVVAINTQILLCQSLESTWILISEPNNVMHYDLGQSRQSLAEQIAVAAARLSAGELIGDETKIINALDSFRALNLPPHLSKRSTEALELAARVIIISRGAIAGSSAVHSPSVDRLRVENLEQLILRSRMVLQSVVTT